MKGNREYDEAEHDDSDRLYSLEDLMSEPEIEVKEETLEILQEIENELLSRFDCEELVKECISERIETPIATDASPLTKLYPVNLWTPQIDGVRIESYGDLLYNIASRSPEFFKRSDASKLLEQAQLHLDLYQEFRGRDFLKQGEVADLSKRFEKSPTTLKRYLREGAMPRMYYWLNMVPSDDRESKLDSLVSRLNGITTEQEYDRRFGNLYFHDERSATTEHAQYDEFARKFLTFIDEYRDSGLLVDIAKKLGIGKSTICAWFDGTQLPTRIAFASLIPQEDPHEGCKWLPMKLNHITNLPENFIQVPVKISSPQDILDVLEQIDPVESERMENYEKVYGELPRPTAFMYLLGLMVSDGSFKSDVDFSSSVNLFVSKKYSWGSTLGEGFQYTMGRTGLSAKRMADSQKLKENGEIDECQVYSSEASPLLMWMKKALLGLETTENKKNVPIKADWILDTPQDWKVAFIQGLADGDGHASIPRFDTAIATSTNKEFFRKLFSSVGIESRFTDHHVKIGKYEEILKAKELPIFRFASGRQEILNDICKIIKLRPKGRQPIPENEKKLIIDLHRAGLKPGGIVENLWHEYGLARTTTMIDSLIHRENKKNGQ